MDPETQLDLFKQAAHMLGGARRAARQLDISERSMLRILSGEGTLHDGFLRDMSAALARHADECRELERQLTPTLTRNLTPDQPREDGRATGKRWNKGEQR